MRNDFRVVILRATMRNLRSEHSRRVASVKILSCGTLNFVMLRMIIHPLIQQRLEQNQIAQ
jgi:hypothetical protein